ncbi:MAG: glycosyltransferase family 39 protein [Cyanobacteria bacterium J06554_6]
MGAWMGPFSDRTWPAAASAPDPSNLKPSHIVRVLWPGLLLLVLLRFTYAFAAFPNPDEAYYWLWGQHLGWSYYDHPPLHGWIQGGFALLGHHRWVLRLPTLISSGLFVATYYRICCYLYGDQGALAFGLLTSTIAASPLYFVYLAMAWQDQWLLTFGLLSSFGLVQFLEGYRAPQVRDGHVRDGHVRGGQARYGQLYRAALYLGLAGLCKYTAVLIGLAGLAVIATQPALRSLFQRRAFYGAVAIALLCQLPILIWNAQNDWLSVAYYFNRSVDSGRPGFQLKPLEMLGFWGLCLLILSPFISWALWRCWRGPLRASCPDIYRALALWLFGLSTGILSGIALFSTALHYWNIQAYLLLLPLLPGFFVKSSTGEGTSLGPICLYPQWRQRRLFQLMQGLGVLVAALLVFNAGVMPLAAIAGPDGDHESRILFGWDQVTEQVQAQLKALPDETLLLTTDYRSAALLAYALNNPQVLAISDRRDQFDVWARQRALAGKPALLLADDWHPLSAERAGQFTQLNDPIPISIQRWGRWIKTYQLYVGRGFQPLSSD